jgi:uncharacterized membrane protein
MSSELEPGNGEPTVGWEPSKLREIQWNEVAIRFAFGAAISVIAAMVGKFFGAAMGGMFLAFPAILPATLTLLEKKHDTADATHNDRGAVLGGLGLIAFAVAAALLFTRATTALVIGVATVAWVVVAIGAYLVVAARHQHAGHNNSDKRTRGAVASSMANS